MYVFLKEGLNKEMFIRQTHSNDSGFAPTFSLRSNRLNNGCMRFPGGVEEGRVSKDAEKQVQELQAGN